MSITYPLTIPQTAQKTRISIVNNVGESVSPFTFWSQRFDWLADRLLIEMTFPMMKRAEAAQMVAFLMSLRGKVGTFLAGDPMAKTPQGVATGTPLVNGANAVGSATLATKGWNTSITGILKAGDWLQVGSGETQRIYLNLADVNSDSSGHATLDIAPRIREALADNAAITKTNTKGTFRLATNQVQWDIEAFLAAQFTLQGVEAL